MPTHKPERDVRKIALMLLLVFLLAVFLLTNIHYDLNDDMVLVRSFSGCVGGVMEHFNIYTHTILTYALHALSVVFPGVAWLSVFQLLLLLFSAYLTILSILRAARRAGVPHWIGIVLTLLFEGSLMFEFYAGITGTLTVAVAGSAAIWSISGLDRHPRDALKAMLPSILILALAYLLRPIAALPAIIFWTGTLICSGLFAENSARVSQKQASGSVFKTFLVVFCTAVLSGLLLVGVQAADNSLSGEQDYIAWQDATTSAIDYYKVGHADGDTLKSLGWSENERQLVMNWYFMDSNMDTNAFARIGALPSDNGLNEAFALIASLYQHNRNAFKTTALLFTLCAGAFVFAFMRPKRSVWRVLAPLGCLGVAMCLLFYLAWQGRLPMRVAMSILLPACSMACWLLLANVQKPPLPESAEPSAPDSATPIISRLSGIKRMLTLLIAIICALAFIFCARTSVANVLHPLENLQKQEPSRYTQFEHYALQHPDQLFIADNSFGLERNLFPNWQAGKATNILYAWGGWNNRSEGYRALLNQFGFAYDRFEITDFLSANVRLVCLQPEPSDVFLKYLEEKAGAPIMWTIDYAGDSFFVLQLRLPS